ncbi:hypothetical protein, partial [Enterococcus asini]|uniref:hypothetical protein n=1 Tax=Enterococcus asini TaxID=57732 RepID=UPI0026DC1FED
LFGIFVLTRNRQRRIGDENEGSYSDFRLIIIKVDSFVSLKEESYSHCIKESPLWNAFFILF